MNLTSAQEFAERVCRHEYAQGNIDEAELERRIEHIIGTHGTEIQKVVLETTEYTEITPFGTGDTLFVATDWHWPIDAIRPPR